MTTSTDKTDKADVKADKTDKAGDADATVDKSRLTTLTEVEVVIQRNAMSKVASVAYKHELPILELIHGDDNVQIQDEYPVEVIDFDAGDEFERLKRKYNRNDNGDVVQKILGHSPERLAQELGVKFAGGKRAKPEVSTQSGNTRPTKPRPSK